MRPAARWTLAAAAAVATACGGAETRGTETARAPSAQPTRASDTTAERERPSDAQIAEAVRWELAADPAVDVDRVSVSVDDGVVTLDGNAPHLLMVDRAVERAEMVWGVRGVVELMDVAHGNRADAAIAAEVRNALLIDPATDAYEVRVRVEDGVATLAGTLDSFAEKRLAERTARAVRGVRGVQNQLEVAHAEDRSDAEIRADVLGALRADRWVDDWLLSVDVADGVVELVGALPSGQARRRAIDAAAVMGVRDVDASELEVQPFMARALRRPPAGYAFPVDEEVHEAVTAALERDPRVSTRTVDVDYDRFGGDVTLQGTVDTLAARAAAAETASTIHGVRRVINRLIVNTDDADPARITRRVDQRLSSHPGIGDAEIAVQVQGDRVILSGAVDALYTRIAAEEAVSSIPGVAEVDNRIDAPPPVPTAGLDDYVLRQQIHQRLAYEPSVDASEIEVDVVDGAATLLGTVHDWRAEEAAIRAAREAGAVSVLDGLQIQTGPRRRVP